MSEPSIELRGIVKSYGNKRVLTGLDLSVPTGSVWDCWARTARARPRLSSVRWG